MRRNIEKLLEQAKTMHTTRELYASEIDALFVGAKKEFGDAGVFSCLITGWAAGYAAGYNKAMKESKASNKRGC